MREVVIHLEKLILRKMMYMFRSVIAVILLLIAATGYTAAQRRSEKVSELPEVVVESPRHKALHVLAYVREYSTLSTYTDTVFLFREKMVDYMLVSDKKARFKGWTSPRILKCRSYYRFTDAEGLDSVSDAGRHHFSWSDWVGIPPATELPGGLRSADYATDTLRGKYGLDEVWVREKDSISAYVNALPDAVCKKWIPGLSRFVQDGIEFEKMDFSFHYDNVITDLVTPFDLTRCSFNIESRGRGHRMFRFGRPDEPFYVTTDAEVYLLDKEYITLKEARKWENHNFNTDDIEIFEPMETTPLPPSIQALTDRVDAIDKGSVRLDQTPDRRLVGKNLDNHNFRIGERALFLLKQLTGISLIKSRRHFKRNWRDFQRERNRQNTHLYED